MEGPTSYLILYGSETGTAEEVAFKIHRQLSKKHLNFSICCLDEYDVLKLPSETCILWIVATAGEGEVPSNMKRFWNFLLRKSLSTDSLKGVSCAVFGLGDSSYEKFNSAARRLAKRLQQLGSKELIPIGLGDDQSKYGYLTELDSWITKLQPILQTLSLSSTFNNNVESDANDISPQHYNVTVTEASHDPNSGGESQYKQSPYRTEELQQLLNLFSLPDNVKRHYTQEINGAGQLMQPILAFVKENTRMTNGDWNQDVRNIVLHFTEPKLNQSLEVASGSSSTSAPATKPAVSESSNVASLNSGAVSNTSSVDNLHHIAGDVATVYPINDANLVSRMISILRVNEKFLNADSVLSIKCLPGFVKRKSRLKQVDNVKLGRLFSSFVDIAGLPQRGFFEGLAQYATNDEEKEKLAEISSAEGTDLYYDYCIKEKRNYVEVLEDFKSARPPLSRLLELLPVLQPRHYSIANSGVVCAAEVHLCVAVTSSKTPYGRVRVGVCSGYLSSLSPGDQVLFWVRSGSFKLPIRSAGAEGEDPPMILVGPGTGVAPMRALIQERRTVYDCRRTLPHSVTISESNTVLFFGCRSRGNDFLYSEEWQSNNPLTGDPDVFNGPSETMIVAFSRDQPQKIYVTDKIKEHGAHVWKLLCDGASIFISGSAKNMPRDVRKSLKEAMKAHGLTTEEEANAILLSMERKGKYVVEAWS